MDFVRPGCLHSNVSRSQLHLIAGDQVLPRRTARRFASPFDCRNELGGPRPARVNLAVRR